ncbi:caspase family protein [Pyxidicoccus sp. 3LG]
MPSMDNAHALVVGISKYARMRPLPETVLQDAEDVAALLRDPARGAYPAAQVRLLPEQEATRRGLLDALGELARATNGDSVVLVYLSAHGGRLTSPQHAGEYLLPIDVVPAPAAELARTAISGQELGDAFRAIPGRKKLLVFDCCHAAGVFKSGGGGEPEVEFKSGLRSQALEALASGAGSVVLASCRSDEESVILRGDRNSLFTRHLLQGLAGDVRPSPEGLVNVFDLFEYVQRRVTDENPAQHPILHARDVQGGFGVSSHPGGAGAPERPYDAFVSFVEEEPDAQWVYEVLLPRLQAEGLKVASPFDTGEMYQVVNIERGIQQARRTLVVLSEKYLQDGGALLQNVMAFAEASRRPGHRVVPIKFQSIPDSVMPLRFRALVMLDLTHKYRGPQELERLVRELKRRD